MSARLRFFLILAASSAVALGQTLPLETYTEEDVRAFVVPGTPREAIIQRFGQPFSTEKDPKFEDGSHPADEILYFNLPLPNPPKEEQWVFSGFQVWLKGGKAVKWMASHRDVRLPR
jgi:hypothetical protein